MCVTTACRSDARDEGDDADDSGGSGDSGSEGSSASGSGSGGSGDAGSGGSASSGSDVSGDPTGSSGAEATAGDTGGGLPPGCECVTDECGPSLCTASAGCLGNPGPACAEVAIDEAAVTCALEALRDATVGTVYWSSTDLEYPEAFGRVTVLEDGRMIHASSYSQIICGGAEPTTLGTLPPPSFYQACLDDPDPRARFDCLAAPPVEVELECVAGYHDCGDQG